MDVRQRINDNPLLAPVLKWDSDDGTLSGSEAALVRIVQALTADLEALDADQQQALEDLWWGKSLQRHWRPSRRVSHCSALLIQVGGCLSRNLVPG